MSGVVDPSLLDGAARLLAAARSVAALTGAGVSDESGVPTFRGAGGYWKNHRAEDVATPTAFRRDPALVWEFYNYRRDLLAGVEPNAGHRALAELESLGARFTLVTQNVDGLHARAGSARLLELHGNIWVVRCTGCRGEHTSREALGALPRCTACGALLRPGVVWFGEPLPPGVWEQAERAVAESDCLLVVGTSAVVQPAASLAWRAAQAGSRVIEINTEPTPARDIAALGLYGQAGVILPDLVGRVRALRVQQGTQETTS